MKKYISSLTSILFGGLAFLFLSISNIAITTTSIIGNSVDYKNCWQILNDYDTNVDGYLIAKIGIIAMIVFASLLVLFGFVMLLHNLGLFKTKKFNFNIVNTLLFVLFVSSTILNLIGEIIMCNYFSADIYILASSATIAIGTYLSVGFSVAGLIISILFPAKTKNKKSRK